MSASHADDEYDEYNYDQDKLVNSGHSGNVNMNIISFIYESVNLTWFFFFV